MFTLTSVGIQLFWLGSARDLKYLPNKTTLVFTLPEPGLLITSYKMLY